MVLCIQLAELGDTNEISLIGDLGNMVENGIMSQRMALPSEVELNCLPINQTTRNTPLSPQGKDNPVM